MNVPFSPNALLLDHGHRLAGHPSKGGDLSFQGKRLSRATESTAAFADFLVERRGFEPVTLRGAGIRARLRVAPLPTAHGVFCTCEVAARSRSVASSFASTFISATWSRKATASRLGGSGVIDKAEQAAARRTRPCASGRC
jgi:hypothetical protein